MCPACIASATLFVAGATSAGGLTALVVKSVTHRGESHVQEHQDPV